MNCLVLLLSTLYIPLTEMVNVKINGIIDLGQNFNFNYEVEPALSTETTNASPRLENQLPTVKKDMSKKRKGKSTAHVSRREVETTSETTPPVIRMTYIKLARKKRKKKATATVLMNADSNRSREYGNVGIMAMQYPETTTGNSLLNLLARFGIDLTPKISDTTPTDVTSTTTSSSTTTTTTMNPLRILNSNLKSILSRPHYVKEDYRLQNFTLHIYKQAMSVFEAMKSKIDEPKIKRKLDFIGRSYREKFAEFVNETINQKIVTKLGTQKVILNTIQTSNRIMQRLMTYLVADMENKNTLRTHIGFAHALRNGLVNEEQQEYVHACLMFNVCRSKKTFSGFFVDVLSYILQSDDKHLKQAIDALTEVIKNKDLTLVLSNAMIKKLQTKIDFVERLETIELRPLLWMLRNLIASKNKPLIVEDLNGNVNKSVAVMDLIDIFDDRIPANDENLLDWNDITENLSQWADGKKTDIMDIMQRFSWHILSKGILKMNDKSTRDIQNKLKILLLQ